MCCLLRIHRTEFTAQARALAASQRALWTVRTRVDELLLTHAWLEASLWVGEGRAKLFVTFYVYYNSGYQQPQLGFSPVLCDESDADADAEQQLHTRDLLLSCFPRLRLLNLSDASDGEASALPLASYGYCEEVGMPMWSVHPCDTTKLVSCCTLDGLSGDLLPVFLHAMAPYTPLQPCLLP